MTEETYHHMILYNMIITHDNKSSQSPWWDTCMENTRVKSRWYQEVVVKNGQEIFFLSRFFLLDTGSKFFFGTIHSPGPPRGYHPVRCWRVDTVFDTEF